MVRSLWVCVIATAIFALAACSDRGRDGRLTGASSSTSTQSGTLTRAEIAAAAKRRGPTDCRKDFKYIVASQALAGAHKQMNLQEFRRTNILLRDGLEALGDVPLGDDVIDDTGLHLGIAWSQEWDGKYQEAAVNRLDILKNRLAAYAELHNLQKCPTPEESTRVELPF